MAIRVGTKIIPTIHVGSKSISRIYVGQIELYPGIANAGILFMVNRRSLFTLDINTGIATRIGGSNFVDYRSLTSIGTTLYATSGSGFYVIDSSNGLPTLIGNIENITGSIRGLTSVGSTLYMITDQDRLYTLNVSTAAATLIRDLSSDIRQTVPSGLTAIENILYILTNNDLYRFDLTTNELTAFNNFNDFNVREREASGLTAVPTLTGHQLYMVGNTNHRLYTLNFNNGRAAIVSRVDRFGINLTSVDGLTYALRS